jgi:hypothetical protein
MLRGDNGALYARHGIGPKLDPRKISGDQAIAVAVELAGQGLSRQIAA